MNYKRVAKCLGGLSVVFALANLHRLPEDIKDPLIRDEQARITEATNIAQSISYEALGYNSNQKFRPPDSAFCKAASAYAAQAESNMDQLQMIVFSGTVRLWILDTSYTWNDVQADRDIMETMKGHIQKDLEEVKKACAQHTP